MTLLLSSPAISYQSQPASSTWVRLFFYFLLRFKFSQHVMFFCVIVGSIQKGSCSGQSGMTPGSWQHKMKLQLILKSSKAYYILSDAAMSLQKYGRALRYIKLALQSHGKPPHWVCPEGPGVREALSHSKPSLLFLKKFNFKAAPSGMLHFIFSSVLTSWCEECEALCHLLWTVAVTAQRFHVCHEYQF